MSEMPSQHDPDDSDLRALATIDPAGPRDPGAHRSPAALSLLATIAAVGATDTVQTPATRRRWSWLAAAAAVVTGVVLLSPSVAGGDGAYAGWTDVPAAASASDAQAAESECREMWLAAVEPPGAGMPGADVIAGAGLILAEQRGSYTYTVLAQEGWAMDCLVQTRTGWPWNGGGGGGGSLQLLGDEGELAADGVADLTVGGMGDDDDGVVLMLYGRVGADVDAAVVHAPGAGDIEATVTNGYLAAWAPGLPADAFETPTIAMTLYLSDGREVFLSPETVDALSMPNAG